MRKLIYVIILSLFVPLMTACSFMEDESTDPIIHTVSFHDGAQVVSQQNIADGRHADFEAAWASAAHSKGLRISQAEQKSSKTF